MARTQLWVRIRTDVTVEADVKAHADVFDEKGLPLEVSKFQLGWKALIAVVFRLLVC